MTPSDELWNDMAHIDTDLADRIWDGIAAEPEDAPPWFGEVATLVRQAKAPGRPDELAGEEHIVGLMRQALLEDAESSAAAPGAEWAGAGTPGREAAADGDPAGDAAAEVLGAAEAVLDAALADESDRVAALDASAAEDGSASGPASERRRPRHLRPVPAAGRDDAADHDDDEPRHLRPGERGRTGRLVRRLVAVKAVAATTAVAIGITAAAATTGIGIVTVVVPAARDRLVTDDRPSREIVEDDSPSRRSESDRRDAEERSRSCAPDEPGCQDGGERSGEPTDPEADPSTTGTTVPTDTTVAGDPSTGDGAGETPTTAPPDPSTGTPSSPATTDTTVSTTVPPSTSTTTSTTEAPPEPLEGQAAPDTSGGGAIDTLAAGPGDPVSSTTTQG